MIKYIFKRIAFAILTLFIIIIFSYSIIIAFQQNPYRIAAGQEGLSTFERAQRLRDADEFDKIPGIVKLFGYLGDILKFEYGKVYTYKSEYETIPEMFFDPLKWTILISLPAFIISAILGTTIGILAGYKRGTIWDSLINVFVFIFIAVPSFVLAPFFINIFNKMGFGRSFISPYELGGSWAKTIKSIIAPISLLSFGSLAVYTLYSRNQVITVLTSNYVLIAKTKGLSGSQIFFKYVFRNISIPLAAIIIPSYITLLSGSIIIERFWLVKGTSDLIINAFPNGETNIVMFNILFFTTLSLFTDVLVDVTFTLIDPRIKYSKGGGINWFEVIKAKKARIKAEKELFKQQDQELLAKGEA
ncbi:ABC transporter permease [Mycoplasmopsis caviae]|uniref:ABC transporter permease n=1 Tax=Mycoplasmopsis caviae TaxID=55603 RepID=A0A3P8L7G4_9BACT|nr:ABC transporter permease [Mycoplasmopsis caviae]UUD34990.1 ABC transporter permease [Mycoplasmopsis caviae]VDR42185.1 oligopeptide ABC transporter permease [Mycoplasmopsis caviae]